MTINIKNKLRSALLLLFALCLALPAAAQQLPQLPPLPIDSAVRYGKLPNGLTYYIRHNALPAHRANFYIAQRVGSVQEEENQRGLAHFLEHMCFNGTDHFPGDAIVKYCESIGVKFGQNLNAYTSTDETVYNIDDVPVTPGHVDSCLLILRDWADGLTLDPKEIDKERGVIHEEWRMRSSAAMRIYERQLPTLYPGSRYGHRFPIGLMSVVDNFKPKELRDYYERWYRPDLQGIIVVGDIDAAQVEAKVKALFGPIKMPANPAAYEHYPVPDNPTPIYVVDKDKELRAANISLMFKDKPLPEALRGTMAFLAQEYVNNIITSCLNARLDELSKKPDCPFVGASSSNDHYLISKTADALMLDIVPKTGQDAAAVTAVMAELERARRFGFNATEIIRARENFMSGLESIYNNRDKQRNDFYVPQYVRHFLEGNAIPDIATEYNTYKMLAANLNADAINAAVKAFEARTDTNFVCLAIYPDKEGAAIPTVDQLRAAVAAGKAAKVEPYVDNVKNDPLISALPRPGKVKKTAPADFGFTCWTLANGARVYYKKTDFNDSQILFQATSFGGKSLTKTADRVDVSLLPGVMASTGMGGFSSTQLEKKLAGKQVSLNVSLGELTEGLSGSSTPKDLRTLFELIYLRFQKPTADKEAYDNFITTMKTALENVDKNPQSAFADSLRGALYAHNPLKDRIRKEDLIHANYDKIREIYAQRFQSAGDFDFFFVGNIDADSLRTFVEQYIAPLPGLKKRETYTDRHIDFATGVVDNHFVRKMETPQAVLVQVWTGREPWNMKNAATINALGEILTQRYLKSIREDAGVAYSVNAGGFLQYDIKDEYVLQIQCPFKPAARDSVLLLMRQAIDDIARNGVTADELDKVCKFELKQYADNQRLNSYWKNLIVNKVDWNKDEQTGFEAAAKGVTSDDIRNFVNNVLLRQRNCVTVSMIPADFKEN